MSTTFVIKCKGCGVPLSFDIVSQKYRCNSCGTNHPADEITNQVKAHNNEAFQKRKSILDLASQSRSVYECESCGARVVMPNDEMLAKCDFCQSSIAKKDFPAGEYPEGIIPFKITLDEAKKLLADFARESKSKYVDLALRNADSIQAYYLPYQMVKGAFKCNVELKKMDFDVPGYLYGIYINQTQKLSNGLLDACEPFDVNEMVDFDYGYLAGHKAMLPNISDNEFENRRDNEIFAAYKPNIAHALADSDFELKMSDDSGLMNTTVYLPMYFLITKYQTLAINGQTGRIAVWAPDAPEVSSLKFSKRVDSKLVLTHKMYEDYMAKGPLSSVNYKRWLTSPLAFNDDAINYTMKLLPFMIVGILFYCFYFSFSGCEHNEIDVAGTTKTILTYPVFWAVLPVFYVLGYIALLWRNRVYFVTIYPSQSEGKQGIPLSNFYKNDVPADTGTFILFLIALIVIGVNILM